MVCVHHISVYLSKFAKNFVVNIIHLSHNFSYLSFKSCFPPLLSHSNTFRMKREEVKRLGSFQILSNSVDIWVLSSSEYIQYCLTQ